LLRFASGADDGLVIIWNSTTGQKLLELRGHTQPITCFLVLDNRTLISGAADKSLRVCSFVM
jgi:WD40 repeat protein